MLWKQHSRVSETATVGKRKYRMDAGSVPESEMPDIEQPDTENLPENRGV